MPEEQVPIFFVCGAFGAGKTTLAPLVAERLPECFVLDVDWLLEPLSRLAGVDLSSFEPAWPALGVLWITLADIAARGGRCSVLFSPCDPPELERMRANHAVCEGHFILLDCADEAIHARLGEREDWPPESTVEALVDAARMRTLGYDAIRTDRTSPEAAADRIVRWVRGHVKNMKTE